MKDAVPASSGRQRLSRRTDHVEAPPSPAPPGCPPRAGSRQASSPPEPGRLPEPKSRRSLHRTQHLRQHRDVAARSDAHNRSSERNLDRPPGNCAGGRRRWRRSLSLHHDRRESHAARDGGALTTDSSPLRIAPPAEQLLRRQTMSTCDCRDFVPLSSLSATIRAFSSGAQTRLRPDPVKISSRRTGSPFDLCKSSVSDTCLTRFRIKQRQTIAPPDTLEGVVKKPLTTKFVWQRNIMGELRTRHTSGTFTRYRRRCPL